MTERLPLFPLNTVLFPEGRLPLRVFEARYMDMVTRCLREGAAFGVCAIAAGEEVGAAAVPCLVGTEARIDDCDMSEPGILSLVTRGERRFRIRDHEVQPDGLLVGEVSWLPDLPHEDIPDAQADLIPLLTGILGELGDRVARPYRLDDAAWVGARYSELLPIPTKARQALLELDDVVSRLEIIQTYLRQHQLLPNAVP
ncbi:MAG: LON peptidase substrate-binding domain-containing protein [Rhodocyclaceae bacterium]|nr:LON peptidase substrate-binding domain-containing protein [Rhodocyclaceae bacterium]